MADDRRFKLLLIGSEPIVLSLHQSSIFLLLFIGTPQMENNPNTHLNYKMSISKQAISNNTVVNYNEFIRNNEDKLF